MRQTRFVLLLVLFSAVTALTLWVTARWAADSRASRCAGFFGPICGDLEAIVKGEPSLGVSIATADASGRVTHATFNSTPDGQPIDPTMLFEVGSITKTFTAARVMQLVNEGRVSLDASISTYVPSTEIPYTANLPGTLTVRQLLNFTAGLEDYVLSYYVIAENLAAFWPLKNMTDHRFYKNPPVTGKPCYTSSNTLMLGLLIDRLHGGNGETRPPLVQAYRQHLFTPAGMTRTSLGGYEAVTPIDSCTNINFAGPIPPGSCPTAEMRKYTGAGTSGDDSQTAYLSFAGPAGGIVSTSGDIARWFHWLFTRGPGHAMVADPQLIGERAYDDPGRIQWYKCGAASAPWSFPDQRLVKMSVGYNMEISTLQYGDKRVTVYSFLGGTLSFNGYVFYLPEHGRSVAVLVNNFNVPTQTSPLNSTGTVYDVAYRLIDFIVTGK